MTQNEHVRAICCWLDADDDIVSGRNVETIKGNIVANFEVASSSGFRDFSKWLFCDADVGDSSVNAICSQQQQFCLGVCNPAHH